MFEKFKQTLMWRVCVRCVENLYTYPVVNQIYPQNTADRPHSRCPSISVHFRHFAYSQVQAVDVLYPFEISLIASFVPMNQNLRIFVEVIVLQKYKSDIDNCHRL